MKRTDGCPRFKRLSFRLKREQQDFDRNPKNYLQKYSTKQLWSLLASNRGTEKGLIAREILILRHLEYAKTIAEIYYANKLPRDTLHKLEDLVSGANLGLIEAIDKYDLNLNDNFKAFAYRRVLGAIIDQLRSLQHLPRSISRLRRDYNSRAQEIGDFPSHDQICEEDPRFRDPLLFSVVYHTEIARTGEDDRSSTVFLSEIEDHKRSEHRESRYDLTRRLEKFFREMSNGDENLYFVLWAYYIARMTISEIACILCCSISTVANLRKRGECSIAQKYTTPQALRERLSMTK